MDFSGLPDNAYLFIVAATALASLAPVLLPKFVSDEQWSRRHDFSLALSIAAALFLSALCIFVVAPHYSAADNRDYLWGSLAIGLGAAFFNGRLFVRAFMQVTAPVEG